MFSPGNGDDDELEIPAFLRRMPGEPRPVWSPPAAPVSPANAQSATPRRDDYYAALVRSVGEERAAARYAELAEHQAIRERARAAKRKAQPSKDYLVGMRWDVESAQYIPNINATPEAKAIAMEKFSKPFKAASDSSARSNARRAARKVGVDPSKVVPCPEGGFYFPLPDPSAGAGVPAKPPTKTKPAKAAKAKKAKAKKSASGAKRGPRGDGGAKIAELARLMRRKAGLTIDEAVRLTGWLKHTTRARISVNVKATLAKGEMIKRRRVDKVSTYFIVPKRQGTLPGLGD